MNLYNVKNIKDLPQLEQILPGNFIVVENNTGTNKLDFSDLVIGPNNTSFANTVFNNIVALSSNYETINSQITALSSSNDLLNNSVSSLSSEIFNGIITTNIDDTKIFYGIAKTLKTSFTIPSLSSYYLHSFIMPNTISALSSSDIFIVPQDFYSINLAYYWKLSAGYLTNGDNTNTYFLEISTNESAKDIDRSFDLTVTSI